MESFCVVACTELPLQYHLKRYTCNNTAYDVNVTLPSNVQVLCKSLQLLDRLLHRKVIAWVNAIVAMDCLAPTREFVRH